MKRNSGRYGYSRRESAPGPNHHHHHHHHHHSKPGPFRDGILLLAVSIVT